MTTVTPDDELLAQVNAIHPAISDIFFNYNHNEAYGGDILDDFDEEVLLENADMLLGQLAELTTVATLISPEALVADFLGRL